MQFNIQQIAERISQALYMATNHIKDSEPLKWELRRESLDVLAASRAVSFGDEVQDVPLELAIQTFSSSSRELISLLSIALAAALISKNNVQLLIREIEATLTTLEKEIGAHAAKSGFVLSEEFFRQLDKKQNLNLVAPSMEKSTENHKRNQSENQARKTQDIGDLKDKKDERVNKIINLLKERPNSTIKDFSEVITDCSEKTIQRELILLVEKGVVKKEGERRWSKYSLINP